MSSCMPISANSLLPLSGDHRLQKKNQWKYRMRQKCHNCVDLQKMPIIFSCRVINAYLSLSISLTFLFARHCLIIIKRVEALEGVRPAENRSARGRRRTKHKLSLESCGEKKKIAQLEILYEIITSIFVLLPMLCPTLFLGLRIFRFEDATKDSQLSCRKNAYQSWSFHHCLLLLYLTDYLQNKSAECFSINLESCSIILYLVEQFNVTGHLPEDTEGSVVHHVTWSWC